MTTASCQFPSAESQKNFKAGAVIQEAFQALKEGHSTWAAQKLEKALSDKQSMGDVHAQIMLLTAISRVYVEQNRLTDAQEHIKEALWLNDKDPRSLRAYSIILYKRELPIAGDAQMQFAIEAGASPEYTQRLWDQLKQEYALQQQGKANSKFPHWPQIK